MRTALFMALGLMFLVSLAFAQGGSIGVFADGMGITKCLLDTPPAGLKQYYVVHMYTAGAVGVQYRAKLPLCMTQAGAMWLSDTNVFGVTLGNSQIGVAIGYGACKVGSICTQVINVFAMGTTPSCCYWEVDADPSVPSGLIEGWDCAFQVFYPTGGQAIINSDPSCPCTVPLPTPDVDVVCPLDMTVPAVSTIPSISLVGFRITNAGGIPVPCAYDYSVTAVGPVTLVDKGNPASLSGTTPILVPGASYYPPEAGLVIPQLRVYGQEFVRYLAHVAGKPEVGDSCTTVITFDPPVPTKGTTWGGVKALYSE